MKFYQNDFSTIFTVNRSWNSEFSLRWDQGDTAACMTADLNKLHSLNHEYSSSISPFLDFLSIGSLKPKFPQSKQAYSKNISKTDTCTRKLKRNV